MMILIVFLLVAIVLLLCTPQAERERALLRLMAIGAVIWLAVKIDLAGILAGLAGLVAGLVAGLFGLAWDHRRATVHVVGTTVYVAGVVLALAYVSYLVYCGVRDHADNKAIRREFRESNGTVTVKFDRRVEALMKLGYDRPKAETAAMKVAAKK